MKNQPYWKTAVEGVIYSGVENQQQYGGGGGGSQWMGNIGGGPGGGRLYRGREE